eukprot:1157637-Pelagomonas_calceolata.AAC.2
MESQSHSNTNSQAAKPATRTWSSGHASWGCPPSMILSSYSMSAAPIRKGVTTPLHHQHPPGLGAVDALFGLPPIHVHVLPSILFLLLLLLAPAGGALALAPARLALAARARHC